jgi:hypothetical protein
VPARAAGWVCRCGTVLAAAGSGFQCGACDRRYQLSGAGLVDSAAAGASP